MRDILAEMRVIAELPEPEQLFEGKPLRLPEPEIVTRDFDYEAIEAIDEMLTIAKLPTPPEPEPEEVLTAAETYREFLDEALPMTSDLDMGPGLTASEASQVRATAKRRRF